ncbi:hypothetical protein [Staphylococcus capitis]|nr:hypothetical protein [Staphylococcus capitis]
MRIIVERPAFRSPIIIPATLSTIMFIINDHSSQQSGRFFML